MTASQTIWHYGSGQQYWGTCTAPTLAAARAVIRKRQNIRSTRGMWISETAPQMDTGRTFTDKWKIKDFANDAA
jgi:hypothetical protein